MIETPTVLVLGAGASVHASYPLGGQLLSQICSMRGSAQLDDLPEGWTRAEAEGLCTRLSRSGHYSVDAFLGTERDDAALGKYLLARVLKSCERTDLLFPPHDSGWYQQLLNALLGPDACAPFAPSRLGVITFNYDRSLEAYLFEVLLNRFRMDVDAATVALRTVPIVHVHGVLGEFPSVPYSPTCDTAELLQISRCIRVIHELDDEPGGFCNAQFEEAHQMLRVAKRIIFLGFGYHDENLRRLRFFSPANCADKEITGTSTGIDGTAWQAVAARLKTLGINFHKYGYDCTRFINQVVQLA